MKKLLTFSILICSSLLFCYTATATQIQEYKIIIKDHKFEPRNLVIPNGKKVVLIVENQDKTIEEFESHDLNREKIVGAGKSIKIYIGPLEAGVYKFFGEFNQKTARGTITVK